MFTFLPLSLIGFALEKQLGLAQLSDHCYVRIWLRRVPTGWWSNRAGG